MIIQNTLQVTGRGPVLITDKEMLEGKWSEERNIERIRVIVEEGNIEYKVNSVELTLKDGKDFISFMIEDSSTEIELQSLIGKQVEPVAALNSEKRPAPQN